MKVTTLMRNGHSITKQIHILEDIQSVSFSEKGDKVYITKSNWSQSREIDSRDILNIEQ